MARTAKKTRRPGQTAFFRSEQFKVGVAAAGVAILFTHGLPLWNEDYNLWLGQVQSGLGSVFTSLLLPYSAGAQAGVHLQRPLQALLYWVQSLAFGGWGTAYFLVKSAAFGALVGVMSVWMRDLGVSRFVSRLSIALFVLSAQAVASLLQLSDSTVLSQLLVICTLMFSLSHIERGGPAGSRPRHLPRFFGLFFLTVYLSSKLQADACLVPATLLFYLFFFSRGKFKAFALPLGLTFLASFPWSAGLRPGQFRVGRVWDFLGADVLAVHLAPISLLGFFGVLLSVLLLAYFLWSLQGESIRRLEPSRGLLLIWLSVALLALGLFPRAANASGELRLGLIALVPAILLFSRVVESAFTEFRRLRWLRNAIAAVIAIQCGMNLFHAYQERRDTGRTMLASSQIYEAVEKDFAGSRLALNAGFPNYGPHGFKSAAVTGRQAMSGFDEMRSMPQGSTVVASWTSNLDPRFSVARTATGCGANLFDLVFPCPEGSGAVLLSYHELPAAVAQANQLDKQGNLAEARQALSDYLKTDPSNQGVAFTLGLYSYRLGDFAAMESAYDRIGPYFQTSAAVMYNWGLAKQGQQKFREAARKLERAYALAPRDYAVGFNLADAYYKMGRKRRALATLTEMRKIYPEDPGMKKAYERWLEGR